MEKEGEEGSGGRKLREREWEKGRWGDSKWMVGECSEEGSG